MRDEVTNLKSGVYVAWPAVAPLPTSNYQASTGLHQTSLHGCVIWRLEESETALWETIRYCYCATLLHFDKRNCRRMLLFWMLFTCETHRVADWCDDNLAESAGPAS